MFSFHKKFIPMNPILLEYIKKSNEQSIEKIIDNNKKNKKNQFLLTNDIINTIVETNPNSNNNFYPILFGLLFISISRGLYFFTYKK
jgi:hypothetical protein